MSEPPRCRWAEGTFPEYIRYHDEEWGVPAREDRVQFEFLILESAQAGLRWATILKRRAGYRRAFAEFDPRRVARFGASDIERLCRDPAIVRNRAKVEAAVNNAKCFLEVGSEFGSFWAYLRNFVGDAPRSNRWERDDQVPASTEESEAIAGDLKTRGFRFVGSTILYAHMQATGIVNDHVLRCFRRCRPPGGGREDQRGGW